MTQSMIAQGNKLELTARLFLCHSRSCKDCEKAVALYIKLHYIKLHTRFKHMGVLVKSLRRVPEHIK